MGNFRGPLFVSLLLVAGLNALPAYGAAVPDEKGVMMYDYGDRVVYNPKVVAAEGIKYGAAYDSSGGADSLSRQKFLNSAEWLLGHAVPKGNYSLWEYDFEWRSYGGVKAPYASALAQAEGIEVLAKAYNMTGERKYLDAALAGFNSFLVDYEDGGVASAEKDGTLFLQILAKPGFTKTYVLNGHTGSLLHLWRYYSYTGDERALGIFEKGVGWLRQNIPKYDAGDWSYYDQMGTKARDNYHVGQTTQLYYLYQLTGDPILRHYADRFDSYNGSMLSKSKTGMPVWR